MTGRHFVKKFKVADEHNRVVVAHLVGNLRDALFIVTQKQQRLFNSALMQIFVRGEPHLFFKGANQMVSGKVSQLDKIIKMQIFLAVGTDKLGKVGDFCARSSLGFALKGRGVYKLTQQDFL